nr:uncharacterized protein LOC107445748 [Parasteatoda tepidariorum]
MAILIPDLDMLMLRQSGFYEIGNPMKASFRSESFPSGINFDELEPSGPIDIKTDNPHLNPPTEKQKRKAKKKICVIMKMQVDTDSDGESNRLEIETVSSTPEATIQTTLLPAPYDTNCTDFITPWIQNNGTGPLDPKDCFYRCVLVTLKSMNSCIPYDFPIPHEEAMCPVRRTSAVLTKFDSDLFDHPPYCPHLAPSDLPVFLHVKKFLSAGENFGNDEELKTLNNISLTITFNQFSLKKLTSVPRIQESKNTIRAFEVRVERKREKTTSETQETSLPVKYFQRSFISSIADVATSKSKKEKWIKLMIFALNVSAFLFFTFDFSKQYLAYETVSIERIERPVTIDRPAITFCNANRRHRKYVCKKYPHKCVFFNSGDDVCSRYPRYCNFLKVYRGVYTGNPVCQDDDCYTWKETIALFKPFIPNVIDNNYKHSNSDKIFTKVPFTDNEGEAVICLSYGLKYPVQYSKINRTTFNKKLKKGDVWNKESTIETWNDISFLFLIELDEYLDPVENPSVYFAIHDSARLVNPLKYGFKLEVPRAHLIQVNDYIEQHLLPYPYDTNCQLLNPEGNTDENFDFTECIESCKFNLHVKQYGCAARSISISHMVKLCKKDVKVSKENQEICYKKCSVLPCMSRMFKYKHMENIKKVRYLCHYKKCGIHF